MDDAGKASNRSCCFCEFGRRATDALYFMGFIKCLGFRVVINHQYFSRAEGLKLNALFDSVSAFSSINTT